MTLLEWDSIALLLLEWNYNSRVKWDEKSVILVACVSYHQYVLCSYWYGDESRND